MNGCSRHNTEELTDVLQYNYSKKTHQMPKTAPPGSFGQLVKFTIKVLYEQRFQNFPEQLLCRTSVSSDPAETYLEPSGASVMEFFCKSSKIVFRR